MADDQQCLIICPRNDPKTYERIATAFAGDRRVIVRPDLRTGLRAICRVEIFAVGGRELCPELRRLVTERLSQLV
jgi:hypothetical protein